MRNAIGWLSIACAVNSIFFTAVCKSQDPAPTAQDTQQTESTDKSSNAKFSGLNGLAKRLEFVELSV